jgi:hypothetical protein
MRDRSLQCDEVRGREMCSAVLIAAAMYGISHPREFRLVVHFVLTKQPFTWEATLKYIKG